MTAAARRSKVEREIGLIEARPSEATHFISKLHCLKTSADFALRVNMLKVRQEFCNVAPLKFCFGLSLLTSKLLQICTINLNYISLHLFASKLHISGNFHK